MTTILQLLAQPADVVMPVDPESLDATRPADLDVCTTCMGAQCISTFTVTEGVVEGQTDECWACNGTGTRGAA